MIEEKPKKSYALLTTLIIILIVAIASLVYLFQTKNSGEIIKTTTFTTENSSDTASTDTSLTTESNQAKGSASSKLSAINADTDINTIDSSLNSVNDDSFNESGLSETEVGL